MKEVLRARREVANTSYHLHYSGDNVFPRAHLAARAAGKYSVATVKKGVKLR